MRTIYQQGGDNVWSALLAGNFLTKDEAGMEPITAIEDGDELVLKDNIAIDVDEIPGNDLKFSKITTSATATAGKGCLSGRGINNYSYTINADEIVPTITNLIQLGAINGAISVTINGNVYGSNTNNSICGVVFTDTTGYTVDLIINGNVTGGTAGTSAYGVSVIEIDNNISSVEVFGNVTATGAAAINSSLPIILWIEGNVYGSSTAYQFGVKNGLPGSPASGIDWTTIYGNVINTSKALALNCAYGLYGTTDATYTDFNGVKAALPLSADKILAGTVNGEVEGTLVVPSTSDVRHGAAVGSASGNSDVQPVGQMPNAFAF